MFKFKPICELTRLNAEDVTEHLVALSDDAKRMRFWSTITEVGIAAYVERINWNRDTCFGLYEKGVLIAFAHLGFVDKDTRELGISISDDFQGEGIGSLIMERIITWCKANSVDILMMECLRDNTAMKSMAKSLGMRVVVDEESAMAQVAMKIHYSERLAEIQKNMIYENIALVDKTIRGFYNNPFMK